MLLKMMVVTDIAMIMIVMLIMMINACLGRYNFESRNYT